jgi:excisionase family DNA binding protein
MSYWLNPEQAATLSGFSTKTIYRALWSGELTASKRRRRWRIRTDALETWIDGETTPDVPAKARTRTRPRTSARAGSLGAMLAEQETDAA